MTGASTTDHVSWRRELGEQVCRAYAEDPAVAATCVVGSVARGWVDEYSDVEILVVWAEAPSDEQRREAVERSGGRIDVDWEVATSADWRAALAANDGAVGQMWPFQDDEYAEHFVVDGVEVGVSGFSAASAETLIDSLLVAHRPTDDAELFASSVLDGLDITGALVLQSWRDRLRRYPPELAAAVMRRELEIDERWWSVDALASRNDRPALDVVLVSMQQRIFRVLLALNRRYLVDPKPKWAGRVLGGLDVKPASLGGVWNEVRAMAPFDAVMELQAMLEATLDLVAEQPIEVDAAEAQRWYRHRRHRWAERPPNSD